MLELYVRVHLGVRIGALEPVVLRFRLKDICSIGRIGQEIDSLGSLVCWNLLTMFVQGSFLEVCFIILYADHETLSQVLFLVRVSKHSFSIGCEAVDVQTVIIRRLGGALLFIRFGVSPEPQHCNLVRLEAHRRKHLVVSCQHVRSRRVVLLLKHISVERLE